MSLIEQSNHVDGSKEGRQAFFRYIDAFNAGDTMGFTSFYTPDMKLHLGDKILSGPQAIRDFYTRMYERVREHLTVHRVILDEEGICVELTATFTAHEDAPDFIVGPMSKGDRIAGQYVILYTLDNGRMSEVRTVRLAPAAPVK